MAWLEPSPNKVAELKKAKKMKKNIQICFRDADGKVRRKSTRTKDYREARRTLAKFEEQLKTQDSGFVPTLLTDAADECFKNNPDLTERAEKRYRNLIQNFLEFAGQEKYVHEISPDLVSNFRLWAKEKVTITKRSGEIAEKQRLADKTTAMAIERVKSVLKYSLKKGYVKEGALDLEEIKTIPKSKQNQKPVRGFTDDELNNIINDPDLDINLRRCFKGLLYLGCRKDELCQLDWENVVVEESNGGDVKGFVRIVHDPSRGKKVKTGKTRNVPLAKPLLKELEQMGTENEKSHPHVFCMETGCRANDHLYDQLRKVCDKHGINGDVTTHSFRHSFIQRHLQAGTNFKTIMQWAGHKDIKTFMVYLEQYQARPEDIDKVCYDFLG